MLDFLDFSWIKSCLHNYGHLSKIIKLGKIWLIFLQLWIRHRRHSSCYLHARWRSIRRIEGVPPSCGSLRANHVVNWFFTRKSADVKSNLREQMFVIVSPMLSRSSTLPLIFTNISPSTPRTQKASCLRVAFGAKWSISRDNTSAVLSQLFCDCAVANIWTSFPGRGTWTVYNLVVQAIRQIPLVPAALYSADRHRHRLAAEEVGLCRDGRVTEAQLTANHGGLEHGPTVAADDTPIWNGTVARTRHISRVHRTLVELVISPSEFGARSFDGAGSIVFCYNCQLHCDYSLSL